VLQGLTPYSPQLCVAAWVNFLMIFKDPWGDAPPRVRPLALITSAATAAFCAGSAVFWGRPGTQVWPRFGVYPAW